MMAQAEVAQALRTRHMSCWSTDRWVGEPNEINEAVGTRRLPCVPVKIQRHRGLHYWKLAHSCVAKVQIVRFSSQKKRANSVVFAELYARNQVSNARNFTSQSENQPDVCVRVA